MKKHMLKGIASAAALAALSVAVFAGSAVAEDAKFPLKDISYRTHMARAMDQCTPSGTTIVGTPQDPTAGCLQANIITDDGFPADPLGATMDYGTLSVSRTAGPTFRGRVRFFGKGFQVGQRVKVRLTLRDTRTDQHTKHPPGSHKRVTFADVTIECGNQTPGNCFGATSSGKIIGSQFLDDCLAQNGEPINLRLGNVEILSSELVNCDNGKVFARPGIRQAPRGVR